MSAVDHREISVLALYHLGGVGLLTGNVNGVTLFIVVSNVSYSCIIVPHLGVSEDVVKVFVAEIYGGECVLDVLNVVIRVGSVLGDLCSVVEDVVAVYQDDLVSVRVHLVKLLVEPFKAYSQ